MRKSLIPYEARLILHTQSREAIIDALLEKQETLYSQYSKAQIANDDFEQERCFDDLADWNYELIEVAELLLVDISHWVEREMKSLAISLLNMSSDKVSSWNIKDIHNTFLKAGVNLEEIPGYYELEVLRLFANRWKHNANPKPNQKLCKALKIDADPASIVGLLTSEQVSKGLGSLLNLTQEEGKHYEISIVCAYLKCAYNYLTTLEQKLN